MDAWRRSVTRADRTIPKVSAHFSGRKWKSGVASSSKPASVRRNDLCLDLACPTALLRLHMKVTQNPPLPSLSAHSSPPPAAPGLILHCHGSGDWAEIRLASRMNIPSASTQAKSMRYEPPAINFHLQETPAREPQGGGEHTECAATTCPHPHGLRSSRAASRRSRPCQACCACCAS